ncbi:hypothetical protein D030_1365A, partial [Vibrio parahaemolyticus AQ3810]
MRQNKPISAS